MADVKFVISGSKASLYNTYVDQMKANPAWAKRQEFILKQGYKQIVISDNLLDFPPEIRSDAYKHLYNTGGDALESSAVTIERGGTGYIIINSGNAVQPNGEIRSPFSALVHEVLHVGYGQRGELPSAEHPSWWVSIVDDYLSFFGAKGTAMGDYKMEYPSGKPKLDTFTPSNLPVARDEPLDSYFLIKADRSGIEGDFSVDEYVDGLIGSSSVVSDDGTLISREVWSQDRSSKKAYFDYDDSDTVPDIINYDKDGNIKSASINARSVAASEIGELFGSMLGRTLGNGNAVAEIAAGTLLGLTLSKVGSLLEAGFSGDLPTLIGDATKSSAADLGSKLGSTLSGDILVRLQGVGSSLLAAELADALGLRGFEGKLFTAAANGVTSEFIKQTVKLTASNSFSTTSLLNGVLNSTTMIDGIKGSFGAVFGSQLGSLIVTPQTPEAAIFASVGSSIGAIVGTATGAFLSWVPFAGPFIGAFLGQVIVGWAANTLIDNDDKASGILGVNATNGRLGYTGTVVWDKGDIKVAYAMGDSVIATINGLLDQTGMRLDAASPIGVEVGYYNNTREWKMAFAGSFEQLYASKHNQPSNDALARVAQSAVDQVIDAMSVVGGDAMIRRAFYNSRTANSSNDDGIAGISFDLQVAKDYRFYLEHEEVVKALIKGNEKSAFAAGWIATLARVNELGLNRGSVNDFKGGFYINLQSHEAVQGPRGAGGGFAPERIDWMPDLDARDVAAKSMKTGDLILKSADGLSTVRADNVFAPGEVVTLTGANSTAAVDGSGINKPNASVILVKAGDGDKIVKGSANQGSIIVGGKGAQTLIGGKGNDWLRAGEGNIELQGGAGDDLLVADKGVPILDGGSGRNTYYLGPNNATVRISALDKAGSDTVVATLAGALSANNTIAVTAKGSVSGAVVSSGSSFVRSGTDLVITTRSADARDGTGKIVIDNFFLSLKSIDAITFQDGVTIQNIDIWNRAGIRTVVDDISWNSVDSTYSRSSIDTNNTMGSIFSTQNTKTADNKSVFDVGIYDNGQMYTVAYDPNATHDWEKWVSEYAANGVLATDRITLDVRNGDGSAIVLTRGGGGVVAGSAGDDTLRSATAGSMLIGDRGNDDLSGSGSSDLLYGGSGDDRYTVGAGDQVFEFAGQGTDVVEATVSYALAAGQEIEELRLANPTSTAALNLTGNERNNTLVGNAGANVLTGGGGSDVMRGGDGNDIYVVDVAGDQVQEGAGEGTDEVRTGLGSYALGAEIEILRYTGGSAFAGSGNALANSLFGGDGNDVLDGGDGNDVLRGGGGGDTYRVDNGSDQVFEAAGEGKDTVITEGSFTLQTGQEIEILQLANPAGTAARGLAGNEFGNTLIGNAGANTLIGNGGNDNLDGGAGADRLDGGDGIDTVSFDSASRGVSINIEAGAAWDGAGDTLVSIENGAGSRFDDTIKGNAGNNTLYGDGGSDTLIGNGGSDIFVFRAALGTTNVDRITDFVSGDDRIMLDDGFMPGLARGILAAGAFKNISQAGVDADDRILYKQATGELFFDADGSGSGAAVRFAILDNKASLVYQDLLVA